MRGTKLPTRRFNRRPNNALPTIITLVAVGLLVLAGLNTLAQPSPGVTNGVLVVATSTLRPDPTDHAELAVNYFTAGNFTRAAQEYEAAIQQDPTNMELWLLAARTCTYALQFDAALEKVSTAVVLGVDDPRPWAMRALVNDWRRQYEQAVLDGEEALTRDANNVLALAVLAKVWVDLGDLNTAQRYLARAMALDPGDLDVMRAQAYVTETVPNPQTGIPDFRAAIALYEQLNARGPELGWVDMRLGLNYRVLGDFNAALAAFERAAALYPDSAEPLIGMSRVHIQVRDYDRARAVLEQAQVLDPNNRDVYGRRGILEYRVDDYEAAIYYLRCAVDGCVIEETGVTLPPAALDRFTQDYFSEYGLILAETGNCERGLPMLDSLVNFAPGNPNVIQVRDLGYTYCGRTPGEGGG